MLRNLLGGLRVALLLPASRTGFHFSWGAFWFVAAASLLANFFLSLCLTQPPLLFHSQALLAESLSLVLTLLAAFAAMLLFGDSNLQLRLAVVFLNSAFWIYVINQLLFGSLLAEEVEEHPALQVGAYYLIIAWYFLASIRSLSLLTNPRPLLRLTAAGLTTALVALPPWFIEMPRFWERDYYRLHQEAQAKAAAANPPLNAEHILTRQWPTLQASWSALQVSAPGRSDLYFVGFAGFGEQDVFRNEVQYSQQLFDMQFDTQGRSLALINSPATVGLAPLANATNLDASLQHLNQLIQPDEDILFLFLTSHGSADHFLSVTLPPLPLNDLDAEQLASLLAKSHFKWKVILVSACYSGGFIKHLQSPYTLVMTAARSDRTSFGCSDDAEFTYFGRAYFVEALQQTNDFIKAFEIARQLVKEWEEKDEFTPSEPQIFVGDKIKEKLKEYGELHPFRKQASTE